MSQVIDSLDEARAAAERQAWRAAYAAFGDVDAAELTAADLENYGEAAWWSGQIEEAIRHRERAFAAYTSSGDTLGAARMALTLGLGPRCPRRVCGRRWLDRERRAPSGGFADGARAWPADTHARHHRTVRGG